MPENNTIICIPDGVPDSVRENLEYVASYVSDLEAYEALQNVQRDCEKDLAPSGTLSVLRENAQLQPSMLPHNLLSNLTLYPILGAHNNEELDDQFFLREAIERTQAIRKRFGEGPSLKETVRETYRHDRGKDKVKWDPTLGQGYFAIGKFEPRQYDQRYYIAVFVPHTRVSDDLNDYADELAQRDLENHEGEHTTFADFLNSSMYSDARRLTRRNNDAIAWIVAEEYGVNIKHTWDQFGVDRDEKIALPTHMSVFNHLDEIEIVLENKKVTGVAIYNDAGSINYSVGGFPIPISPRVGIQLYKNVKRQPRRAQNIICNAVPCGVRIEGSKQLSNSDRQFNLRHIFWPGKVGQQIHPSMTRAYSEDEFDNYMPDTEKISITNVVVSFGTA